MSSSGFGPYQPIDCATYSEYELAIMRACRLKLCWRGRGGIDRVETLLPTDLRTRSHAEYLIARNLQGAIRVLRLDRIRLQEVLETSV